MSRISKRCLLVVSTCHIMVFALIVAGCAAGAGSRTGRETPTQGVTFTLFVQRDVSTAALYEMDEHGNLSFGGGWDARNGVTSWTGAMSPEEIEEVLTVIDDHGWFERKPTSAGEPDDYYYRLTIAGPEGRKRYSRIAGESPEIEPVVAVLDRIARRRFDDFLKTLPRAGEKTSR
jgi:hypothetical protein